MKKYVMKERDVVPAEKRAALFERVVGIRNRLINDDISDEEIKRRTGLSRQLITKIVTLEKVTDPDYTKILKAAGALEKLIKENYYHSFFVQGFHRLEGSKFAEMFLALKEDTGLKNTKIVELARAEIKEMYSKMDIKDRALDDLEYWEYLNERFPAREVRKLFYAENFLENENMLRYLEKERLEVLGERADSEQILKTAYETAAEMHKDWDRTADIKLSEEEEKEFDERLSIIDNAIDDVKGFLENNRPPQEWYDENREIRQEFEQLSNAGYSERFDKRVDGNETGLNKTKLTASHIEECTADQQKAILSVFLKECLDEDGYILPECFGSAIRLLDLHVGYSKTPIYWVEDKSRYKIGDKIDEIGENDPIREFVASHPNVLICNRYLDEIEELYSEIYDAPTEVYNEVFLYLKKKFYLEKLGSDNCEQYYKTISEYFDLVSRPETFKSGDYSREQIYSVLYSLYKSDGDKFCPIAGDVINIANKYAYMRDDWIFELYIYSYCVRYRKPKKLVAKIKSLKAKALEKDK